MRTIAVAFATSIMWIVSASLAKSADRLPTSFEQHVQLACDASWTYLGELPKMTRDKLGSKLNKASLCSCISNDARKGFEHPGYKDVKKLYDAAKKYAYKDLDFEAKMLWANMEMRMAQAQTVCSPLNQ